jgi:hypothetical protein
MAATVVRQSSLKTAAILLLMLVGAVGGAMKLREPDQAVRGWILLAICCPGSLIYRGH